MNNIKVVIFDMDGLMVNTEPMYFLLFNLVGSKYNFQLSFEEYCKITGSGPDNAAKVIQKYPKFKHIKEGVTTDMIKEYFPLFFKKPGDANKPGLRELYEYLKKNDYKIAIASNSFKEIIQQVLHYLGFEMKIDVLMTGEDLRPKPNPDILLKIAEKLDVQPSEWLVLEDSSVGIEAAVRANMKVGYIPDIAYVDGETRNRATFICKDLAEVIAYLK